MKFRGTLYALDDLEKRWTVDFEARGPRAARAWLSGYAGENNFGIYHDPEAVTGDGHDLPVMRLEAK